MRPSKEKCEKKLKRIDFHGRFVTIYLQCQKKEALSKVNLTATMNN
jgi:actin-related protein